MDLETENRIAALLMQEATKLRLQAEKEGVHVYLRQPKARGRPNSWFLTATVRGVQQANRAVEVNEMWRVRMKELELDDKLKGRSKDEGRGRRDERHADSLERCSIHADTDTGLCTSSKRSHKDYDYNEDGSLRDEEIEVFLHSRAKRGRGAVGSRMDEPGPYLPSLDPKGKLVVNPDVRVVEEWEQRVLGPEKPPFMKSSELESDDVLVHDRKKAKKVDVVSSRKDSKHKLKKHKSREEKRKEKKSKSKHQRG